MKKILLAFDKEGYQVKTGDIIFDEFNDYKVIKILKKNCVRVKYIGYVENKEDIINTKKCTLEDNNMEIGNIKTVLSDKISDVSFNGKICCV